MQAPTEDGGANHALCRLLHGKCSIYPKRFLEAVSDFWRRYQINKELFMEILHGVREYDNYFVLKHDAVGMAGFSSIQKCTVAMRLLAYGAPGDSKDEYPHMSESTTIECMYRFCRVVVGNLAKTI